MKHYAKGFIAVILTLLICFTSLPVAAADTDVSGTNANETTTTDSSSSDFVYLSDIAYESAKIGYGVLHLDGNMGDSPISLLIDGNRMYFEKGITAHASSTLVYNLADYKQYKYFTSYIGIDASQGSKGYASFHIYTSLDGSEWTEVLTSGIFTAASESEFVSIDISEVNYIKLFTDANGGNGNDHTTFADAKLTNSPSGTQGSCSVLKTLEEYDEILNSYRNGSTDYTALLDDSQFVHTLLQRTFIANAGYNTLSLLCGRDEKYPQIIEWLLNDEEALSLYITGGEPCGSYQKSLEVLYDLYTAHGEDMNDSQYGDLYKKMIITLSLTHAETVYAWQDSTQISDPVYRYEIYKDLHSDGLLWNDIFENLTIEEMRWVLNAQINDDEIKALNTYVRENNSLSEFTYENWCGINGYSYITYTLDYSYPPNPSIFDIFENGAVCGGISKSSVNIRQVFGVPGATLAQPGHCAWLDYRYSDNDSICYIGNNVFGWTQSKREGDARMPCGWGNSSWKTRALSASYAFLSQAALNDEDNYDKAVKLLAMADVFSDEAEAICRAAIDVQSVNLDAYYKLIMAMDSCGASEAECLELIEMIENNLYGYPLPMWDLISLIKRSCTLDTDTAKAEIMISSYNALMDGVNITSENSTQPDACKVMANDILSTNSLSLANFSLSGESAGILQLYDDFSSSAVLEYSLDGGESWVNTNARSVTLSDEELALIDADKDILVRLAGMENYAVIDITKAATPTGLYNNDLENKVINALDTMEWSFDQTEWTLFGDSVPDLTGDVTLYVRVPASGTVLPSDTVELNYTEDIVDYQKSYIKLDRVSVVSCSSEASSHGEYAYKAIDGNINTYWHTNWTANSDLERYIIFELDGVTKLSAIDYTPRQSGSNGRFTSCEVYVSLDGENWTLAGSATGWANNSSTKTLVFDQSVEAKYVKVTAPTAYANFGSAAMINFYEDISCTVGDVNSDGLINLLDGLSIARHAMQIETLTGSALLAADVNDDSVVNLADAIIIQKYVAKMNVNSSIGSVKS